MRKIKNGKTNVKLNGDKSVGIMTFWGCPNFGSFLQAYALREVIAKMYPEYHVKQIAYSNKRHMDVYYSYARKGLYSYWGINPSFYLDLLLRLKNRKRIERLRNFKNYYQKYIEHTNTMTQDILRKEVFDTLVMGSDIIWDYSVAFFDNDPFLFGEGIKANNKISYASSFGSVGRDMNHPKYVTDAINKIDCISVRDDNSRQIVEDITGKKVPVVLDPTLLWDFKHDTNIPVVDLGVKYVVVYGSFFTVEQINGLKEHCKKNDYKILYLDSGLDECDWCDYFVDAATITPFEWCAYIRGAEYIMTCTFHGFLFGLVFEKRIVFNATSFIKAKIANFLKELKLYSALVDDNTFAGQIKCPWDYDLIKSVLARKKEESLHYLQSSIKR